MSGHEFQKPLTHEVAKVSQPMSEDFLEADTRLVAGTRKLAMVLFWLLKMPAIPSQEELNAHLEQVARDSEA